MRVQIPEGLTEVEEATYKRLFHQWVLRQLVENIESYRNGVTVTLFSGRTLWLIPVISHVISDWPEGQEMMNMKQGAGVSARNCRVCWTPTNEFAKSNEGLVYRRRRQGETEELSKHWREKMGDVRLGDYRDAEKKYSQYFEEMAMSDAELYANEFGFHSTFPFDTLHTIPLGIVDLLKEIFKTYAGNGPFCMHALSLRNAFQKFNICLHFECNYACVMHANIKQISCARTGMSPSAVHIVDHRLATLEVPKNQTQRCMHYRPYTKGMARVRRYTGDDNVALLQQMAYVVGTSTKVIRASQGVRVAFIKAVHQCQIIYLTMKKREVLEGELQIMHAAAKEIGCSLSKALSALPTGVRARINLNRPKLHALLHFRYLYSVFNRKRNHR